MPCLHEMYFAALKTSPESTSRIVIDGVDCSFFEDLEALQDFGTANKESLGALLFGFFHYYAHEFDYNSSVISIRHGKSLTKFEKGWDRDIVRLSRFLCVEEPFNPHRNLSNSADLVAVLGLREEVSRALQILIETGNVDRMCERFAFPPMSNGFSLPVQPTKSFEHFLRHPSTMSPNTTSQYHKRQRPRMRDFGTGMYPTHHKQLQTDRVPPTSMALGPYVRPPPSFAQGFKGYGLAFKQQQKYSNRSFYVQEEQKSQPIFAREISKSNTEATPVTKETIQEEKTRLEVEGCLYGNDWNYMGCKMTQTQEELEAQSMMITNTNQEIEAEFPALESNKATTKTGHQTARNIRDQLPPKPALDARTQIQNSWIPVNIPKPSTVPGPTSRTHAKNDVRDETVPQSAQQGTRQNRRPFSHQHSSSNRHHHSHHQNQQQKQHQGLRKVPSQTQLGAGIKESGSMSSAKGRPVPVNMSRRPWSSSGAETIPTFDSSSTTIINQSDLLNTLGSLSLSGERSETGQQSIGGIKKGGSNKGTVLWSNNSHRHWRATSVASSVGSVTASVPRSLKSSTSDEKLIDKTGNVVSSGGKERKGIHRSRSLSSSRQSVEQLHG